MSATHEPIDPKDLSSKLLRVHAEAYCDAMREAPPGSATEPIVIAGAALGYLDEAAKSVPIGDAASEFSFAFAKFTAMTKALRGRDTDALASAWRATKSTALDFSNMLDNGARRHLLIGNVPAYFVLRARSEAAVCFDPNFIGRETLERAFGYMAKALEAVGR